LVRTPVKGDSLVNSLARGEAPPAVTGEHGGGRAALPLQLHELAVMVVAGVAGREAAGGRCCGRAGTAARSVQGFQEGASLAGKDSLPACSTMSIWRLPCCCLGGCFEGGLRPPGCLPSRLRGLLAMADAFPESGRRIEDDRMSPASGRPPSALFPMLWRWARAAPRSSSKPLASAGGAD